MEVLRATETWQQAGAYYVRIQAMAKKHHITLREEFDEHDGPDTRYIVLLDDDFPVATARMYPLSDRRMVIGRVVVLPECRHRGLGTQVVEECEAWARELGFDKAVLDSRENKTEFYRKLGYVETGEDIPFDGTFRCVRMEKALK
ncbi:MAG: GNAT family N-acetyltransferase [Eubacteriales bacterium]|nr:GNAT family N-acetyltransferase [Eubacteriales bacterium]